MTHSKKFTIVKWYYDHDFWNKQRIYDAVNRWIYDWEYEEITGEKYQ